jgi:HD-GYP domain-containing protein (c-di-GMP phosphodiesterase class II)
MPVVWVKNGPLKGSTFELLDAAITIGRDPTETIQILDQGVSRQHARIERAGEMCFIRDLHSTNGTFVNDQRIVEELLRTADQVRIGSTTLVFEDRAPVRPAPREVEFAGPEGDLDAARTVEIQVDRAAAGRAPALGSEITSRHLEVLYEIARIAASEKDPDAVLALALEQIGQAVEADRGYVFLLDRSSGKLVQRCVFHEGPAGERKVSRAIVREVMHSGRSTLTSDATADARFALHESVVLRRIRCVMAAPLLVDGRPAGLLYLHSERVDRAFGQSDLELVTAAAIQLGLAAASFQAAERSRRAVHGLVTGLVAAAERRVPDREGHSARVAHYATAIALQMGLPPAEVQRIQLAALLHDIGKLAVPPEPAAAAERDAWRGEHVKAGETIVGAIPGFEDLLPGIRYHHERADGKGFPYGKKNDEVPVMARILIVANVFDLLCEYGGVHAGAGAKGLPLNQVLIDIGRNGRALYDGRVIEALLVAHRNGGLYQVPDVFSA